jgi:hypothetical protein
MTVAEVGLVLRKLEDGKQATAMAEPMARALKQ